MKYEYTSAYKIVGLEHKSPEDADVYISNDGRIRALLTKTSDKFNGYNRDRETLFQKIAELLEHNQQYSWMAESYRNAATTPPPNSEDALHLVIQINGEGQDLDGKKIIEEEQFVVHLNPNDPSESIRAEWEYCISSILVSLELETRNSISFSKTWDSIVMEREDGKRTIPLACRTSCEVADYDSLSEDAPNRISKDVQSFCSKEKDFKSILRLCKWSLETEGDQLRSFIFAWDALEMFVETAFKNTYKNKMSVTLGGILQSNFPATLANRILGVMKGKYSFADTFTIIAVHLCAADAVKDDQEFRRIKKIRNALFHGSAIDESTLPVESARDLLMKYLRLHLGGALRPSTIKGKTRTEGYFNPLATK